MDSANLYYFYKLVFNCVIYNYPKPFPTRASPRPCLKNRIEWHRPPSSPPDRHEERSSQYSLETILVSDFPGLGKCPFGAITKAGNYQKVRRDNEPPTGEAQPWQPAIPPPVVALPPPVVVTVRTQLTLNKMELSAFPENVVSVPYFALNLNIPSPILLSI